MLPEVSKIRQFKRKKEMAGYSMTDEAFVEQLKEPPLTKPRWVSALITASF